LAAIKDLRVRHEVLLEFSSIMLPESKILLKDHTFGINLVFRYVTLNSLDSNALTVRHFWKQELYQ